MMVLQPQHHFSSCVSLDEIQNGSIQLEMDEDFEHLKNIYNWNADNFSSYIEVRHELREIDASWHDDHASASMVPATILENNHQSRSPVGRRANGPRAT